MRMLIRFSLAIYFITVCQLTFSQVIDANRCDSSAHLLVTTYASFLRTEQPVTLDSVLKVVSHFTRPGDKTVMAMNYDPYYYWFRIIVNNSRPESRNLMLLMAPFGLYDGRLFQKKEGKWAQVGQTGLKYRFRDRSYQFTHHVFPFTLPGQSTDTLLFSIDASNAYKSFGFALLKPKELKIFESNIYFVFGIIVGLLILFFTLNISLFFALKEKLHLWYALYIALLFLVVMKNDQLDQQFLGLDSERAFRLTPYAAIGASAIAVLLHVVQQFLKKVLVSSRLLYRCSTLLKINVLCSAAVHAVVFLTATDYHIENIVFGWVRISVLLGICILIANCLYCVIKGPKSAWFLLSGSFVFMVGSVQRLFFPSTLSFLFPPTTFHVGIILEVFIISMALMYRYWRERELQRQKEEQIKIQTLHDISEEIHDNIGQILTLANLNLKTIDYTNGQVISNKVSQAKLLISNAINDLRGLSRTLKNETAQAQDISEQINNECQEVEKACAIKAVCRLKGDSVALGSKRQAMVLRIIKEALQNVIKHSQASDVEVVLQFKKRMLSLEICDNGIGFDTAGADLQSNGLKNIKSRCVELNATCRIESKSGAGTQIYVDIPV